MGFFSKLLGVGAAVAAPFTGGTSLAALPGILGAGSAVTGALEGKGGNKTAGGSAAPPVPYIQSAPVSVPPPPTFGRPAAEQAIQEEAQRVLDASRRGQRTMFQPLPDPLPGTDRRLLMYPHSEDEFNYS